MRFTLIIISIISFVSLSLAGNRQKNNQVWEIGFTFGEIPILAGSFKPGISVGYHLNEHLNFNIVYQLTDNIQRNDESFNAESTGLAGLLSSKETTGQRMLISVRYKPVDWSPYIIAGFVYNNDDVETMKFDQRLRGIGEGNYNSNITIKQARKSGFEPAVGFGYQYDFDNGISLNTSIAAAVFSGISKPKTEIESSAPLSGEDKNFLNQKIWDAYKSNFHNHYHIFNIGVSYRFE